MGEDHVKVVLYELNCDAPEHDHAAFCKAMHQDPAETSEYRSDECETLGDARAHARAAGWRILGGGTAVCPMCQGKPAP